VQGCTQKQKIHNEQRRDMVRNFNRTLTEQKLNGSRGLVFLLYQMKKIRNIRRRARVQKVWLTLSIIHGKMTRWNSKRRNICILLRDNYLEENFK